jgi:hypothetical protein
VTDEIRAIADALMLEAHGTTFRQSGGTLVSEDGDPFWLFVARAAHALGARATGSCGPDGPVRHGPVRQLGGP